MKTSPSRMQNVVALPVVAVALVTIGVSTFFYAVVLPDAQRPSQPVVMPDAREGDAPQSTPAPKDEVVLEAPAVEEPRKQRIEQAVPLEAIYLSGGDPELALVERERDLLRIELERARQRISWLETELLLCGSQVTQGPIGRWLGTLQEHERPPTETLRTMAGVLESYPVELTVAEGVWVCERIEKDDWKTWGDTIDEALITFLGVERLKRELPADRLSALRAEWPEIF